MPGQLILGAKMKRMLEWLTFSSRHRYDFQVQDFLIYKVIYLPGKTLFSKILKRDGRVDEPYPGIDRVFS